MKDTVYIVLNIDGAVRMTKRWPSLSREEIGVQVKITVPDQCFRSPIVSATLDVPEERAIQPVIEMEIGDPQ